MRKIVSVYGSHNAAIAFLLDNEQVKVIEIERLLAYKNSGLAQYKAIGNADEMVKFALNIAKRQWNIENNFDLCISSNMDSIHGYPDGTWEKIFYDRTINAKEKVFSPTHHICHANGTFYQSPFDKAVIISFDGGGNDGFFNFYVAHSRESGPQEVFRKNVDLGFSYMVFGDYIREIKKEPCLADGNLIYSGKLMGLCGYGKIREEWIAPMKKFYISKPDGLNYKELLKILWSEMGISVSERNGNEGGISGQLAYDVAATSQKVFEDIFMELVSEEIKKYPDYPICVSGGCALNVLLNTKIKTKFSRKMYVAPNSNDCGIAVGALLEKIKPKNQVNLMYAGPELYDPDSIGQQFYKNSSNLNITDVRQLPNLLATGKIIGVARGGSEHGPRALGNRSILCNPAFPKMKDILNEKVKHREWYRPFAPVVKIEEANKYFDIIEESPYMSYAFDVKHEWREKLSSITHVDGTARVQTLRKEHNPWLYNLLEEFEKISGHGVLLNTSFNVNGQPILSTVAEAFTVLYNTQLDGILLDNTLIMKK